MSQNDLLIVKPASGMSECHMCDLAYSSDADGASIGDSGNFCSADCATKFVQARAQAQGQAQQICEPVEFSGHWPAGTTTKWKTQQVIAYTR